MEPVHGKASQGPLRYRRGSSSRDAFARVGANGSRGLGQTKGIAQRRGVIRVEDDALRIDDELAERDPALARLARAAVSGLAPAGPELRRRPVELAFEGRPGLLITAPLSVREHGFSLHAATRAGAEDDKGREALLEYILRPPVATERIIAAPGGLVRVSLKKPFSDGTPSPRTSPASSDTSARTRDAPRWLANVVDITPKPPKAARKPRKRASG